MVSRKEIKDAINEIHERGAMNTELYAEYNKRKLHVQLLETQNDNRLVVFPSVDAPWYKMGWNSALFYAYDVGIRANAKNSQPVMRHDTDHATRSREGIVFIRDINKLIGKLAKIGINKYEVMKDGIYIFDLGKTYSKAEIKSFKNTYHRKNEELFNMAATKKVYPELRGLIVKTISMVFPKCKNLVSFYQNTIGAEMVNATMEMNAAYFDFVNKRVNSRDAFVTIVGAANKILSDLTILSEIGLWSPIELMEVGGVMIDMKTCVARIIKKGTDGSV